MPKKTIRDASTVTALREGDAAPDFAAPDQEGKLRVLSEYKGEWVLLYFYPKDDTPGCTAEACGIRDNYEAYGDEEVTVLGVSTDAVKSHAKFATKYALPFTLLADEDKKIVEAYGVWGDKTFMGRDYKGTRRMSFLIDPKGRIAKIYDKVRPADHAEEVLDDVRALRAMG